MVKQHRRSWVLPNFPDKARRLSMVWLAGSSMLLFAVLALYVHLANDVPTVLSQVLYLPILLAAAFFELRGGLAVGVVVALAFTPLLGFGPSEEISTLSLVAKGGLYVLFGLSVGALFQAANGRFKKAERKADHLSEMYTKMLQSLANTVEVRDRHTQGHCERVARNAVVLGKAFGFNAAQLDLLYWSALLHDLGKIAIPEYILLKDSKLSDVEFAEVKRHPEYGADLLSSVSLEFAQIAEVVRSHHERWDGKGYPFGLRGENIPLMSRIISVVDVFEALTSRRPYRRPMLPEMAMDYIRDSAGEQFDPSVVSVFEACYVQGDLRYSPEAGLATARDMDAPLFVFRRAN